MKKTIDIFFLLIFFLILVRTIPPTISVYRDSGELASAAITYGIAHPPGYPLYVNISRVFSLIKIGNPAYFLNITSGFFLILMCFLIKKIVFDNNKLSYNLSFGKFKLSEIASPLVRNDDMRGVIAGSPVSKHGINSMTKQSDLIINEILTNLIVYFTIFSSNIILRLGKITEIYSLNNFLTVLIIYFLFYSKKLSDYYIIIFLLALSLTNQQISIILFFPIFIYFFYELTYFKNNSSLKNLKIYKFIIPWIFISIVGFSLYLYLPLRSSNKPAINWGSPNTFVNFMKHISRADYGKTKLHPTKSSEIKGIKDVLNSQVAFIKYLKKDIKFIIIFIPFIFLFIRNPKYIFLIISFIISGCIMAVFVNMDYDPFSISMSETIFGYGILFILIAVLYFISGINNVLLKSIICITMFFIFLSGQKIGNQRNEFIGIDYPKNILMILDRDSTLFLKGDDDVFPTDYLTKVEKYRQDLRIYDYFCNVFENIYGPDYRLKKKEERQYIRNKKINEIIKNKRNVFYSSMERENIFENNLLYNYQLLFNIKKDGSSPKLNNPDLWQYFYIRYESNFIIDEFRRNQLLANIYYIYGQYLLKDNNRLGQVYLKLASEIGKEADWLIINISSLLFNNSEKNEAIKILKKISGLYPLNKNILFSLAVIYAKDKNYNNAKSEFENIYNKFKDFKAIEGIKYIGMDLYKENKYNESLNCFITALKYLPEDIEIIRNIAIIYYKNIQNKEMALFYLNKYLELSINIEEKQKIREMIYEISKKI